MKTKKPLLSISNLALVALFSFALSCTPVKIIADYDANIKEQIELTSKKIDYFYLSMLETTSQENEGRAFSLFQDKYIEIESELVSIYNRNRVRPLNQHSTRISEISIDLWQKYKNEHKSENSLENGDIIIYRRYLNDLFFAMLVAEHGKDFVKKQE